MIAITAVGATADLSNRNSFHNPTFLEMTRPIAASITPNKMPYWTAALSESISVVMPCSCNCRIISCEYISGIYNPVQYPPINPLHKTKSRNFQLFFRYFVIWISSVTGLSLHAAKGNKCTG